MPKEFSGEGIIISTDDAVYPYAKKWIWTSSSYHAQKNNWKLITDLNVRTKTIKVSEENIGVNLCDLELYGGFLEILDFVKIKNFYVQRTPSTVWNDNPQDGRKYLLIVY